jgi:Na+/phosphate symporter
MITILVPLLMVVAGVLLFALASHPALKEFGRAMMWAGLFAIGFAMTGRAVHLF